MNKKRIELFNEVLILDSVEIKYYQGDHDESDLLNFLKLRVINNGQKMQYRFYGILEYNQKTTTINTNELFIDTASNWFTNYMANFKEGYQRAFDENGDDIKITADLEFYHYVFIINGYYFNILCKEYILDEDGFFETYRKDEKIKKLLS